MLPLSPDRDGGRWLRPVRSWTWLGALAGLGLLACGGAHAQSGDFPATPGDPNEVPSYTIPEASCDTIRDAIDSPFDLVVACSLESRGAAGRETPCDLLAAGVNVGVPVGQCQDTFPLPLITPDPGQDFLERDVNLAAVAAGQNLALGDGDRISVTSVDGSAGEVLGLVNVSAGACGEGDCPLTCGGISVRQSATACTEVTAQLTQSVSSDPPELSHALFLDVQQTASPGFLSVAVCPGYKWTCSDPATPAVSGTDYFGQLAFGIDFTPVCFRTSRLTYCCATRTDGTVVKPCPR